ncbi:MAG: putative sulfate exporter family transporter [Pirellulales bacterium]|nr:putative sulfate exporter family transporter [Pirellulales bacterium]
MAQSQQNSDASDSGIAAASDQPSAFRSEDVWAIWLGWIVLAVALAATWWSRPDGVQSLVGRYEALTRQLNALKTSDTNSIQITELQTQREELRKELARNPLRPYLAKLRSWSDNPLDAFVGSDGNTQWVGLAGMFLVGLLLFGLGVAGMGERLRGFPAAFFTVYLLSILSFVLADQKVVKHYNLEYALWALVIGLIISNTIGTPQWLRPAVRTEFYIKTGLVLLGAEVLFNRLLSLGAPGIFVSWVVTPTVLIATYAFGQRILRIPSRSLNMVISADMSVCGVSAAVATAAACRAKREELSLAIGLSLSFTVIMMVVMPAVIEALGMGPVLGGAWIGGTIDSTGAVAAAGGMLGETALAVAVTIKMIQNILIGVVAFGVAVYWVTYVDRKSSQSRPSLKEVWRRFPKFILGFLAASLVFSGIAASGVEGNAIVSAVLSGTSATLRGWFFCFAFVSIGLETNFRELRQFFKGGKPLVLYVCGQTLNLILTLAMAWLMFEKVFPNAAISLAQ